MLRIADHSFHSRLFLGSGKFASPAQMLAAVAASGTEMVTLALKRMALNSQQPQDDLVAPLRQAGVKLLPNTSGAMNAKEAVFAAELAREALGTHWVKLEIHPEQRFLLPDPEQTLIAARQLCQLGFVVLPYCSADPVLCLRLQEAGCAAVMPLAAPIGSNLGPQQSTMLEIIIEQAQVPVIIDAGLGLPSHAMQVLELGADAVLINSAIAGAANPIMAAQAFGEAVAAAERWRTQLSSPFHAQTHAQTYAQPVTQPLAPQLTRAHAPGLQRAQAVASSPISPLFAYLEKSQRD